GGDPPHHRVRIVPKGVEQRPGIGLAGSGERERLDERSGHDGASNGPSRDGENSPERLRLGWGRGVLGGGALRCAQPVPTLFEPLLALRRVAEDASGRRLYRGGARGGDSVRADCLHERIGCLWHVTIYAADFLRVMTMKLRGARESRV